MQYFMLNKPPKTICARRDFAERSTVYDHIPAWYPDLPHVGRLDWATEGLLLFTDDGRLAQGILNSGFKGEADATEVPPLHKVYLVKVRDRLDPEDPRISLLSEPLSYPGGVLTRPAAVRFLEHRTRATWLEVRIDEGRHHQVRHLCARSGFPILKLRRVRIGPIELGELKLRWCRPLTEGEVAALYAVALPADPRPPFEAIVRPVDPRPPDAPPPDPSGPDPSQPDALRPDPS